MEWSHLIILNKIQYLTKNSIKSNLYPLNDPTNFICGFKEIKQNPKKNEPDNLDICKDSSVRSSFTYPYTFAIEISKNFNDAEYKEYHVENLLSEFVSLVGSKAYANHQILTSTETNAMNIQIVLYVDSNGRRPISVDFIKACIVESGLASSNDVVEVA